MTDEFENKIEVKSDVIADTESLTSGPASDIDHIPAQEVPDQELYHSHSWWTTYVCSQNGN